MGRDLTGFGGQWHIPDARPSDQVDKRGWLVVAVGRVPASVQDAFQV